MSPSRGAPRRSGDPRTRAAAPAPPVRRSRHLAVLAVAIVTAATLSALALVALRPEGGESQPDTEARQHAEAACDLTTKAGEAAESGRGRQRARYAASVLLLDWAIIESGRAAASDAALVDLDTALEAVHAAGHEGDPDGWRTAMSTALAECEAVQG